jgi:hypothetical protein
LPRPPAISSGRGDAQEDGAKHQEDQHQRRDQHKRDLLGQARHQADLEVLVHQCQRQCQQRGHGHRHDEDLVARRRQLAADQRVDDALVHTRPRKAGDTTQREQHEQRPVAAGAVAFAVDTGFGRQRRYPLGLDDGHHGDEGQVQRHEQQPRQQRAGVHVAHRAAELVGQHDEHQRRRDRLRQRAAGRDGAGGNGAVVAIAQHDGQRDQAHRDYRCGDDASGRGEQRADQDHRDRKAAAHRAEDLAHSFEQGFGHA